MIQNLGFLLGTFQRYRTSPTSPQAMDVGEVVVLQMACLVHHGD